MKKILIFLTIIFITSISDTTALFSNKKLNIDFYYNKGCNTCKIVKNKFIPELLHRFKNKLKINYFDLSDSNSLNKLLNILDSLNFKTNSSTYLILNNTYAFSGLDIVNNRTINRIKLEIKNLNSKTIKIPKNNIIKTSDNIYKNMSFPVIAFSGFLDGLNPCALTTLVFFVSMLLNLKFDQKKILISGILFSITTFITYSLIGLGFLKTIVNLSKIIIIKNIFNYGFVLVLWIFSILSFVDAYKYSKSEKNLYLVIPEKLRKKINKIIKFSLKNKNFYIGSIISAFIVTILESVCTGQLYIPVLYYIFLSGNWTNKTIIYFITYNLMFILPIIIILIAILSGYNKIPSFIKNNVVITKIVFGFLFIILSLLIIF